MSDIYTGIDLGTSRIKIVVSQKVNDKFHVLASVSSPSKGIKNGFVEDTKLAVASVKSALKKIENSLGIKIEKVVACIPSVNCKMNIVLGTVNVVDYNEITGVDISNVLLDAMKEEEFKSEELVTAMPISFTVDEQTDIKDPKGMKGSTLSTKVVISTVSKEPLYRILEVLKLSGLETIDISYASVGDYYCIKNHKYDELVGAIINIGEESTNISVFNKGIQIKNSILPVGSLNVDKDITYVFKASLKESRVIKEDFSLATSSHADEARVREILKLAKNEIKNLTNREIRYIIVTGGLTELSGFSELVEQEFGFVAKVLTMTTLGIRHNQYSSSYGIIKYFDDKLELRGKHYNMISKDDGESLLTMDSSISKENMLNKVFGDILKP